MTECTLTGAVYDKSCPHCMTRFIVSLRSPDKRLSRKLQDDAFGWMAPEVADEVKRRLKDAR